MHRAAPARFNLRSRRQLRAESTVRFSSGLALLVAFLLQVASSATTMAPVIAAPVLLHALGLSTVAIGAHMSLLFGAAMVSVQYSPALISRLGPIRASQLGLLMGGCGLLLVGVPHLALACMGTILIGAGSGPIMPASSVMLARSTAPGRYAFVFSVKQTSVPLGGCLPHLQCPRC